MARKSGAKAPSKSKAKAKTDAPVLASRPSRDQHLSMSVRKIANGYIVSKSETRGDKYTSRETFTPTMPKISIGVRERGAKGGGE